MRALLILTISAGFCFGCAGAQTPEAEDKSPVNLHAETTPKPHDGPRPYESERNAMADVSAAIETAGIDGTKALIVMGANWCHDSRGLAGRFERPEFQTLISNSYELVYVSAGTNPGQNNQNREISERFGVDKIEGTPAVFIVDGDGNVLNSESTGYWRRADTIPVDMSYAYFEHYAQK
jgi:hypothetical protein